MTRFAARFLSGYWNSFRNRLGFLLLTYVRKRLDWSLSHKPQSSPGCRFGGSTTTAGNPSSGAWVVPTALTSML